MRRCMTSATLLLLLALPVFLPGPRLAHAGSFADQVMAPGLLTGITADRPLRYDHDRRLPAGEAPGHGHGLNPPQPLEGAGLLVAPAGDAQLQLTTIQAGDSRDVATFPAGAPNPALLFFLENVMRSMAVQTGGSPHYIRNRIRDALALAEPDAAGGLMQIELRPFADDPNRARMGEFADLALTVSWRPDQPARILLMQARSGDGAGYLETLKLAEED